MEITAAQFSEACARSSAINKSKSFSFKMRENDYALHLYLGMFAVIAVNPSIDISDLERIKGFDVLKLTDIGMLFTYRRSGATSEENNSEKPPGIQPSLSHKYPRSRRNEADRLPPGVRRGG